MYVTAGGKRWRLDFVPAREIQGKFGDADCQKKRIRLCRSLLRSQSGLLETVIHEMLHAEGWPLDEAWVEEASDDIARVLIRLGFTRGD
jgi:hypothetical protein